MELHADARLPFPRPVVFAAYRDKVTEMLEFVPNVRKIDVRSRDPSGPIVKLVNVWHGGGEIPAAARAIISESMLSWTDHATWNEDTWRCDWRIEAHAFTDAVSCSGYNLYKEDGDGTLVEIRGTLSVDAKKLRGVPGFLAGKVGRTVEQFLGAKIQPNLVEVTNGLRKYLEARAK
jgi:hypothetical protein